MRAVKVIRCGFSMWVIPQVRQALDQYRHVKETLEAISELNQQLLRLDRDQARTKKPEQ
jgi:hypothetical protein